MGDTSFRVLIIVVCIVLSSADVCEDVDTKACELMVVKRPDLCSDPCLSKLCPRYCKQCPVSCYSCDSVDHPTQCTNVVGCPSKDHYCYTTQSFASDFTEVYRMGCAMKDICQQYLGPDHRKRNIDVNGACCMKDKCNNRLPLEIITAEVLTTPPVPSVSVVDMTSNSNSCQNLDDVACSLIVSANPGVCGDACFVKVCPGQCGGCFNCYDCDDLDSVTGCNKTTTCTAGHDCFIAESFSPSLRFVYRVGCIEEQLCARLTANTGTVFGRRDNFILKGSCCKSELCNDHISGQPPMASTMLPSNGICTGSYGQQTHTTCPSGYAETKNSCYLIGPDDMSWDESKAYCETHCGRLADFTDRNELAAAIRVLLPQQDDDEIVWTDARYISKQWIWFHSGQLINDIDFNDITSSHPRTHTCGIALIGTDDNGDLIDEMREVLCDEDRRPLCEAPKF